MARKPTEASRNRSPVVQAESAVSLLDTDGRYHGLPRRSRAALAFNILLLAPIWIVSAVISPLVPGVLFAGILALSLIVLARGGVPPGERRLAVVSLVMSANALLIGLFLWRIQAGS